MAKMIFQKGNKTENGVYRAGIDDAHIQIYVPAEDYDTYDIVEFPDSIYNNVYTGKKYWSISGDTISEVDWPEDRQLNEEDFKTDRDSHLSNLKAFKEDKPNHPKMDEIDACISCIEEIDLSSITYPHDEIRVHCAKQDKMIVLPYI